MDTNTNRREVRELASSIMRLADKKGWGLGECRFNLNRFALDRIDDCSVYLGTDERFDSVPTDEYDRCDGDHEAHIKEARVLASAAYELACLLEDKGITNFS